MYKTYLFTNSSIASIEDVDAVRCPLRWQTWPTKNVSMSVIDLNNGTILCSDNPINIGKLKEIKRMMHLAIVDWTSRGHQ